MNLISVPFWIFFLITLFIYYILPGKFQWIWLLLSGLFFYYESATWQQCLYFLLFVLINWFAAFLMDPDGKHRKAAFRTALILDLIMLAGFKYCGFLTGTLTVAIRRFNPSFSGTFFKQIVDLLEKAAPPRISYFSLILIAYLADVYWGRVKAQKNPGKLLLFSSYFSNASFTD